MRAYVPDGLLDRILKVPVTGVLTITREDADIILSSDIAMVRGGPEVVEGLLKHGRCTLLGRDIVVGHHLSNVCGSS